MVKKATASLEGENLAKRISEICDKSKAEDIVAFDVTGLSLLTDYYLICTANSEPHLRGISNRLQKELGDEGAKADRVDGSPASRWIVLDYGSVLVHIFHADLRRYYEIEKLFDEKRRIIGGDAAEVE